MYSAKQKAEIIVKAQQLHAEGNSLNSIAKELNIDYKTLDKWLSNYSKEIQENPEANRTHEQKVADFLEQMKRDQEDIIRLAAQRVKETIAEANGQVANNILNTTTNNYRVSVGKANEIVEVRDWASFLEELEKKK